MTYQITHSDGSLFVAVADQSTNTSACSLTLVGRGAPNYGEILMDDLVHLMENFANEAAPTNAVQGQTWWDRGSQLLRVLDATGTWESIGFGGKVSGNDGAISTVSLSVKGEGLGFININPNAPVNSTRFRTLVLDSGAWALQALNDDGTLKSTPLSVSGSGQVSTLMPVAGEAATATRLGAAVALGLSGDATGAVQFDGSTGVNIPVSLSNTGVVAGTYLSVVVDSKGRVIQGGGLSLGSIRLSGDVTGQGADNILTTLSDTGVATGSDGTGTYSSVVVDTKGRVTAGLPFPSPAGLGAYTIWSSSTPIPVGGVVNGINVGQSGGLYLCMSVITVAGSAIYLLQRTS